jgi:hypothetical protein
MSLFCTACGCSYGTPREEGESCGDLSCWSKIACAGVLRDVLYDDDMRRLQETSHARDVEGKLLEIIVAGKLGLDYKAMEEIRLEIAAHARDIAAKRVSAKAKAEVR